MSFEWETEEDYWDDSPPPAPEPPRRRRGRGLLVALFIVGLMTTAVWLVYRQAQNRIETAETAARQEILTSHNLIIQASTAQDDELLTNLLSGRDSGWTSAQLDLLRQNQLFDRPLWGLQMAVSQPTTSPTITLSPELNEAILTTAVQYTNPDGGQPLTYQHQFIYRRGSDRWLLSPPERTIADRVPSRYSGTHLVATFPVQDSDTAQQIARDLNDTVATLCLSFDVICPDGRFLNLSFSESPQTLLDMLDPGVTPARPFVRNTINLPSPALVGSPTDEASYQQLFQGYANYVLGPLLEYGLEQAYGDDETMRRIARQTYAPMLGLVPPPDLTATLLPQETAQSLALLCHQPDGIYPHLFDPSTAVFTPTLRGRHFQALYPAPDDRSLALVETLPGRNAGQQLITWEPASGAVATLTELPRAGNYRFSWREHPLAPRLQIVYTNNGRVSGYERFRFDHTAVPDSEDVPGEAFWSEDGLRTLIRYSDGALFLGDEAAMPQMEIGRGFNPFWIDNETYGYFAPDQNIQMMAVGEGVPFQRITAAELEAFRPSNDLATTFAIPFVIPVPENPALLLILGVDYAVNGMPTAVHFFTYNRLASQVTRLYTSDQIHSFFPDPTGQTLALAEWHDLSQRYRLIIIDLDNATATPYILPATAEPLSLDWDASGDWLAILAEQQLSLWQASNDQLTSGYPATLTGCLDLAWVD